MHPPTAGRGVPSAAPCADCCRYPGLSVISNFHYWRPLACEDFLAALRRAENKFWHPVKNRSCVAAHLLSRQGESGPVGTIVPAAAAGPSAAGATELARLRARTLDLESQAAQLRAGQEDHPCPASHPHLEEFKQTGRYWCYASPGNGGDVCKMSSSGLPLPSHLPRGAGWGTTQKDCTLAPEVAGRSTGGAGAMYT